MTPCGKSKLESLDFAFFQALGKL